MPHIEKEHLEEITALRNDLSVVVSEAGQTTLQIKLLEADIERLKSALTKHTNTFSELLQKEESLIKRLSEKYGTVSINFDTGEYTSEK